MRFRIAVLVFYSISACIFNISNGNDDLVITYQQKIILDKFKEAVINKLPHDYMKQDVYLIRFLRARSFNLEVSERMLMENIKWRETNNIDNILNEEWSDMEEMYPYAIQSFDRKGQPILTADAGQYDLRAAAISGKLPRLVRYADRMAEHLSIEIRKLQNDGKNVTKGVVLADIDGFNMVQTACPQCIYFFFQFYSSFEQHHPGLLDKAIMVNSSQIFKTLFQALADRLLPETRDIIRLYSRDRRLYSKELLKMIAKEQLAEKYGGTRS